MLNQILCIRRFTCAAHLPRGIQDHLLVCWRRYTCVRSTKPLSKSCCLFAKPLVWVNLCAGLSTTYSLVLPDAYTRWTESLRVISDLSWTQLSGLKSECFDSGFQEQLLINAAGPLVIMVTVFIGVTVWRTARSWKQERKRQAPPQPLSLQRSASSVVDLSVSALGKAAKAARQHGNVGVREGMIYALPFVLFLIYLFLPPVTSIAFKANSCTGYADGVTAKSSRYFLREDTSITCSIGSYDDEQHNRLTVYMWIFVAIWPIGLIAFTSYLLWQCRGAFIRGEKNAHARDELHDDRLRAARLLLGAHRLEPTSRPHRMGAAHR